MLFRSMGLESFVNNSIIDYEHHPRHAWITRVVVVEDDDQIET